MNPFVFIVGCPRSGTTLLRRIIDAHPEIAITRETHWITKSIQRSLVTPDGLITPALLAALRNDFRFTRMVRGSEELERLLSTGRPMAYSNFVSQAFDLYAESQGKLLAGDKTPDYVLSLPTLHRLWPQAKFVHLVRDGRDTALSLLDWSAGPIRHLPSSIKQRLRGPRTAAWWGGPAVRHLPTWEQDPVTTSAVFWDNLVRRGRADGTSLGPELYYELQYESLVDRPEQSCTTLCDFLGVPFHDQMLRFHERREKRLRPFLDAKAGWRPVLRGLRDWRREMSEDEVERFEAAAGELLEELGYPRTVQQLDPSAVANAAKVRDLLAHAQT